MTIEDLTNFMITIEDLTNFCNGLQTRIEQLESEQIKTANELTNLKAQKDKETPGWRAQSMNEQIFAHAESQRTEEPSVEIRLLNIELTARIERQSSELTRLHDENRRLKTEHASLNERLEKQRVEIVRFQKGLRELLDEAP